MRLPFAAPALVAGIIFSLATPANADDLIESSAEDRIGLSLTIFEGSLALVTDSRRVGLRAGGQDVTFDDVAHGLMPQTALVTGDGVTVKAQVFDGNVISAQRLAQAFVGDKVGLKRTNVKTGVVEIVPAEIISMSQGLLVEVEGRIESASVNDLVFEGIPDALRLKPALMATLESAKKQSGAKLDLRYLTGGISWSTDYVAELDESGAVMGLTAWASLHNRDALPFPQTRVRILSGDLNRVQARPQPKMARMEAALMAADAVEAPGIQRQSVSGYYAYDLPGLIDLGPNQSRQVALITAPKVKVVTEHVIDGQSHLWRGRHGGELKGQAIRKLKFENAKDNGLGLPLPGGVVRFYQGGTLVGEDNLQRLGKAAEAELTIGRDFDVTYVRKQTDYKKLSNRLHEAAQEVKIINGSDKPVTVRLRENLSADWQILSESHPHHKVTATRADWVLDIPEGGTEVLSYRVRVQY